MHRDGTPIPLLLTTALVDGDDGMHFFTQLQDLRDRHRADRFSQAVAELSRVALELPGRAGADAPGRGDRAGRRRTPTPAAWSCATSATARCASSPRRQTGIEPELPRGHGSQAGYTLAVEEAVVANDLEHETRFEHAPVAARDRARAAG